VTISTGPVGAAEAAELVAAKECSWSCLYADGLACTCRCDGSYHGDLLHASPRKRGRQPVRRWPAETWSRAECGCWYGGGVHIDCVGHRLERRIRKAVRRVLSEAA
jgi:hypothetical protein